MTQKHIPPKEARSLAEKEKRRLLSMQFPDDISVLEDEFFDLEHCYVFYRKAEIEVAEGDITGHWAVAVSKKGGVRSINDFRGRTGELPDYQGYPRTVEEAHELIDKLAGEQDWN